MHGSTIKGVKSANERFAEHLILTLIEGLMQDGKHFSVVLHFLGQNLLKHSMYRFCRQKQQAGLCMGYFMGSFYCLMGALIMTHSDDNGSGSSSTFGSDSR